MILAAIAAAALPAVPAAAAPLVPAPSAVLSTASGHVLVARDGRLLRAAPSMRLLHGDRVLTRPDAAARIALNGCALALGPSATATIGSCADTRVSDFAPAAFPAPAAGARAAGPGASGATVAVALAGLAALVAGAVAAAQPGGVPNSP